jgi:hypothetical protein
MDEILDAKVAEADPVYLKRSIKLSKIYIGLFAFSLIMSMGVAPGLRKAYGTSYAILDLIDALVALPMFAIFVLAPLGVFYSIKSKRLNEGRPKTRRNYMLVHLFFCLLIVLLFSVVVTDILILLK